MPKEEEIRKILDTIPDPEIGISIVALGLVYGISIDASTHVITITMTLTTIGCPLFDHIAGPIRSALMELPGVKDVLVELTFEPPWSVDLMSADAKLQLGFS